MLKNLALLCFTVILALTGAVLIGSFVLEKFRPERLERRAECIKHQKVWFESQGVCVEPATR